MDREAVGVTVVEQKSCSFYTEANQSLKPQCLHPQRVCDYLVDRFLSVPICGLKHRPVDPKIDCQGCAEKFAKCCLEKCPERKF